MPIEYGEIYWDHQAREAAAVWGLDLENVEAIVRKPQRAELDPHTHKIGHLVVKYFSGDVVVVAGHLDKEHPQILHVSVSAPMSGSSSTSRSGKGTGAGSSLPTTNRDLMRRITDKGCKLKHTSGGHLSVHAPNGDKLITMGSTPSDHRSIANAWRTFMREYNKHQEWLKKSQQDEEAG